LDVAAGASVNPQRYLYAGNTNDVVEIFELKNSTEVQPLQEVLTTLRTVADIQKIYVVSTPRLGILRADSGHIALAEFLVAQLDQPAVPRTSPSVASFAVSGDGSDSVIVYGLAHAARPVDLQEVLTDLRTVLRINKIYMATAPRLLAIRGDAGQIQMAEWLIPKVDAAAPMASGNEMQVPGGKDDVVHVFYLAEGVKPNDVIQSVRGSANLQTIYQRMSPPAVIVRAKADEIAVAGKLMASDLYMNR
jgi:hypothetical protein